MRHLITLIGILLLSCTGLFAQPGDPGDCGTLGNPPCDPGQPAPITGIEILIGAGALLGAKRMIKNRKANP